MFRFSQFVRCTAAAALTAVGLAPAFGQSLPPATLPDITDYLTHNQVAQAGWGRSTPVSGCPTPCDPCTPGIIYPGTPSPGSLPSGQPIIDPNVFSPTSSAANLGGFDTGVGTPSTIGGAYIETAVPVTMARLRFDAAYGNNRPDRAEFFYAKCGCFAIFPPPGNPLRDPGANGPPLPERLVDYQELTPTVEYAINPRWSVFVNLPVRWINPEVNRNAAGLSDISFGSKYAVILNERRAVTLYLRTIAPSGRATSGLGTANWWLEPGILWQEQLTCKWQVFGEVRDQFSLAPQSDFTGNVIRYGLGTNYIVASGRWGYVAPVAEFVGWTVLSGRESLSGPVPSKSAYGDTIVNAKIGLRVGFGQATPGQAYPSRSDLYVGYGRALTGEVWYQDLFRLEYRFFF
jgi:hypothetical protein